MSHSETIQSFKKSLALIFFIFFYFFLIKFRKSIKPMT